MERLSLVSLLAFLPVCLGVSPSWSFVDEVHGRRHEEGVLGSVLKEGGVFQYREGSSKGI